jgi:predicted DNA-binding WGR domain protein/very-short-patch-repair endonuclease
MTCRRLSVYEPERVELAPGDRVRMTRNDAALDLANGDRFIVTAVSPSAITLIDGKRQVELPADRPLHLDHAYATTIHSSQGTTADRVLIDAATRSRTTAKDVYYVAISRAQHEARIYFVPRLPPRLAAAFRTLPLGARALEAAIVDRSVAETLQADPALHRFDAAARERHLGQLARLTALWQDANAGAVLERARETFLERVRISSLPAAELTREQRRLNVAFSRAKHHMCVVASIRHAEITNDYNDGASCLRSYLRYAETASAGDSEGARRVLREVAVWRELGDTGEARRSAAARQIAAELSERGYAVETQVGMSHFQCDLAVRRHGDERHRLGVLVDGEPTSAKDDLLERDLLRPSLLRTFGWRIAQVLSSDWYRERKAVLDRLVALIEHGEQSAPGSEVAEEDEDPWAELDAAVKECAATPVEGQPDGALGAAASPPARGPASGGPTPGRRRFEFVGGTSRKFWEIGLVGSEVTVRFGRIGTAGQSQQKLFADAATASRTAERLVREKLAKGYAETAADGA